MFAQPICQLKCVCINIYARFINIETHQIEMSVWFIRYEIEEEGTRWKSKHKIRGIKGNLSVAINLELNMC